jgi:hypothetical protein
MQCKLSNKNMWWWITHLVEVRGVGGGGDDDNDGKSWFYVSPS